MRRGHPRAQIRSRSGQYGVCVCVCGQGGLAHLDGTPYLLSSYGAVPLKVSGEVNREARHQSGRYLDRPPGGPSWPCTEKNWELCCCSSPVTLYNATPKIVGSPVSPTPGYKMSTGIPSQGAGPLLENLTPYSCSLVPTHDTYYSAISQRTVPHHTSSRSLLFSILVGRE